MLPRPTCCCCDRGRRCRGSLPDMAASSTKSIQRRSASDPDAEACVTEFVGASGLFRVCGLCHRGSAVAGPATGERTVQPRNPGRTAPRRSDGFGRNRHPRGRNACFNGVGAAKWRNRRMFADGHFHALVSAPIRICAMRRLCRTGLPNAGAYLRPLPY